MAIVNGYASLDELKDEINIKDKLLDTRLERIIEAISRLIDLHCGFPWRRFYDDDADVTRYFETSSSSELKILDLKILTSVSIDRDGDGVFEESWVSTDYNLYPLNAAADSRPFESLQVTRFGGKSFPTTPRGVKVIGKWGWPAVPSQVKEALLLEAARRHKRGDAPFGIALGVAHGQDFQGMGVRLSPRLDVDAQKLLNDLVRAKVAVR